MGRGAGVAQLPSQAVQRSLPALLLLWHPPPTRPGPGGIPSFLLPSSPAHLSQHLQGALGAGGSCFLRGDPRSSGKFPLLPPLGWGPRAGVCWPHYIPVPKPLALLQAVSGGFRDSEKAPFLLWALQPSAGSLRRGRGWGETPFPPVYWRRPIQLNGNRTQSPRLPQPNESGESFPDLQRR